MKSLKHLFGALTLLAVVLLAACNNNKTQENQTITVENTAGKTRSAAQQNKVMGFTSLAAFKDGKATMNFDQFAKLQGQTINLVVLYDAMAPWAETFNSGDYSKSGDDKLNGLMAEFGLVIASQFELDESTEGLVMEPNGDVDAVEAARQLSLVEHVYMVHVKEVPADQPADETADNH